MDALKKCLQDDKLTLRGLQQQTRNGIPDQLRPEAWLVLLGCGAMPASQRASRAALSIEQYMGFIAEVTVKPTGVQPSSAVVESTTRAVVSTAQAAATPQLIRSTADIRI